MDYVLEKLKNYMADKDLTVYKLTELSGLSINTVYNWYNKGAEPSLGALRSICDVLDISMSELFNEGDSNIYTNKEKKLINKFRTLSERQKDFLVKFLGAFTQD